MPLRQALRKYGKYIFIPTGIITGTSSTPVCPYHHITNRMELRCPLSVVPLKCQSWLLWLGVGNVTTSHRRSDQYEIVRRMHGKDRALDLEPWDLGQVLSAVSAQVSSSVKRGKHSVTLFSPWH